MTMNHARLMPSSRTRAEASAASPARRLYLPPSSSRPGGFTLIELLVVLGIIALLLALVLPVVQGMRARAWEAREIQNLRSIHQATMLFLVIIFLKILLSTAQKKDNQ